MAIALCVVSAGCPQAAEKPQPLTPVFLISIDTLRADAVVGSKGATATPHLIRFREESVSFNGAFSEIPFTLPAHATMLTGAAPDAHGLFGAEDRLPPSQRTLAQVLGAAGYRTAAVVSSDWLKPDFGFGRGFDSYDEVPLALTFADEVTRLGMQRLDSIVDERRTPFIFLHYYDAHSDFELNGNKRAYFSSPSASEELSATCGKGQCAPSDPGAAGGDRACATGFLLWANRHAARVSVEQRACLLASYRAGVADLDAAFARLREGIERRGLWDQALIVVTSDHGEEFGEHGQFIHAQPFVENQAIPLWIKLPAAQRAGTELERPAQLADVMPTILGQLGLTSLGAMTGQDLLDVSAPWQRLILGQNKYKPELYSAQSGRWKLIHDFVTGRSKLFDLENDAAELTDVADSHPDAVAEMLRALERRRAELLRTRRNHERSDSQPGEVLTPEAKRRLESLGYVN